MKNAEIIGLRSRKHAKIFEEMQNAIIDSLSDIASADDEKNGEDEECDEENSDLRKLSDDD